MANCEEIPDQAAGNTKRKQNRVMCCGVTVTLSQEIWENFMNSEVFNLVCFDITDLENRTWAEQPHSKPRLPELEFVFRPA